MFVIMQCWNNLPPEKLEKSIPEKVGLTLRHAGVSITVTSLTDFAAFVIGGTTVSLFVVNLIFVRYSKI
jgi:hypothetical protein